MSLILIILRYNNKFSLQSIPKSKILNTIFWNMHLLFLDEVRDGTFKFAVPAHLEGRVTSLVVNVEVGPFLKHQDSHVISFLVLCVWIDTKPKKLQKLKMENTLFVHVNWVGCYMNSCTFTIIMRFFLHLMHLRYTVSYWIISSRLSASTQSKM